MYYVIQDHDGPFITEDKSVMDTGDKLLCESEDHAIAKKALGDAIDKWLRTTTDEGPEVFWRDYT